MREILNRIGLPALLEQTAEECSELAQACLKYSRAVRGENPTPKSFEECEKDLAEEIADVLLVIEQLAGTVQLLEVDEVMDRKFARWEERLK